MRRQIVAEALGLALLVMQREDRIRRRKIRGPVVAGRAVEARVRALALLAARYQALLVREGDGRDG